jgi:hypothetical protein
MANDEKPKLVIFCEGITEREVLKAFLKPYWLLVFRDAQIIHYEGNGELKRNFAQDVQTELESANTYALCLVDLWGEPFGVYKQGDDIGVRYQQLQAKLYSLVPEAMHSRFGAFPVVMELETWILAAPDVQKKFQSPIPNPETIEQPSAKLDELFGKHYGKNRSYSRSKTTEGRELFSKLVTAQVVYDDNCPHFQQIIHWLQNPKNPLNISLPAKTSTWYLRQQQIQAIEKKILETEIGLKTVGLSTDEKITLEQQLDQLWQEFERLMDET